MTDASPDIPEIDPHPPPPLPSAPSRRSPTSGTGGRERCSVLAERRQDSLAGSASPVSRWLLVEQPGPWGRDALTGSRLDFAVGTDLTTRARAAGVRVLLVRRPGRAVPDRLRQWAIVNSAPGHEQSRWGSFTDDHELLSLPLDPPPGEDSEGTVSRDPIYLVCTHGRHDPCCALRGRPVAEALAAHRPDATWECSHVGGDRFAANVLVLPHGLYYGHITPASALDVVSSYEAGRVLPGALRGRSSLPAPVQAAQHYAREALGDTRLEAMPVLSVRALEIGTWQVGLGSTAGPVTVTVREEAGGEPVRLTCAAARLARPRAFRLLRLEPHSSH